MILATTYAGKDGRVCVAQTPHSPVKTQTKIKELDATKVLTKGQHSLNVTSKSQHLNGPATQQRRCHSKRPPTWGERPGPGSFPHVPGNVSPRARSRRLSACLSQGQSPLMATARSTRSHFLEGTLSNPSSSGSRPGKGWLCPSATCSGLPEGAGQPPQCQATLSPTLLGEPQ